MYSSITAGEVMKMHPGHYVSLVLALPSTDHQEDGTILRFTRVKLLRRNDYLMLGQAYRLVTSHEVMKILRAKRHAKMTNIKPESMAENQGSTSQVSRHERILTQRLGSSSSSSSLSSNVNVSTLKSKPWQPSLQSIAEADRGCFGGHNPVFV
ncbi:tetratricopeptide repeat protein like protein [Tanacetum coccineum]